MKRETGRPHHVYIFPNGMVACFDQYDEQMPKYQGRKEEALPKLQADYPNINLRHDQWHHEESSRCANCGRKKEHLQQWNFGNGQHALYCDDCFSFFHFVHSFDGPGVSQ